MDRLNALFVKFLDAHSLYGLISDFGVGNCYD
jgi:hypothetical protein